METKEQRARRDKYQAEQEATARAEKEELEAQKDAAKRVAQERVVAERAESERQAQADKHKAEQEAATCAEKGRQQAERDAQKHAEQGRKATERAESEGREVQRKAASVSVDVEAAQAPGAASGSDGKKRARSPSLEVMDRSSRKAGPSKKPCQECTVRFVPTAHPTGALVEFSLSSVEDQRATAQESLNYLNLNLQECVIRKRLLDVQFDELNKMIAHTELDLSIVDAAIAEEQREFEEGGGEWGEK
jgi:multidrug efflux pump subunit AcrA (membrane-fusion protein)